MKKIFAVTLAVLVFESSATTVVHPGQFIELYAGAKMGGPGYHSELMKELKVDKALKGYELICIKGRDRSSNSKFSALTIEREKELLPIPTLSCKGSAAILIGPLPPEAVDGVKQHIDNNYMHLVLSVRSVR